MLIRRWLFGIPTLNELSLADAQQAEIMRDAQALMKDDFGPMWPFKREIPRSPEGVVRRRLAGRLTWLMPFVPAAGMLVVLAPFMYLLHRSNLGGWSFALLPVVIVVQLALTFSVMKAISRRTMLPYVAAALRGRGFDVCMRCGYRGGDDESSRTCPECGLENTPLRHAGAGAPVHREHRDSAID